MSSTLIVNKTSSWMPSSGVHDEVSTGILEDMYMRDQQLYVQLSSTLKPGWYWDFTELDNEQFVALTTATIQAFHRHVRQALVWSKIGKDVTNRVSILYDFSQLKALMLTDERFPTPEHPCEIRFNADIYLTVPFWMYSFALEILAFSKDIIGQHLELGELFLNAASEDQVRFEFPVLTEDQRQLLLTWLEWYASYFAPTDGGRVAYSPDFTPIASAKVQELFNKFKLATG